MLTKVIKSDQETIVYAYYNGGVSGVDKSEIVPIIRLMKLGIFKAHKLSSLLGGMVYLTPEGKKFAKEILRSYGVSTVQRKDMWASQPRGLIEKVVAQEEDLKSQGFKPRFSYGRLIKPYGYEERWIEKLKLKWKK